MKMFPCSVSMQFQASKLQKGIIIVSQRYNFCTLFLESYWDNRRTKII